MSDILATLDKALARRPPVYLHCRAGIGRTGTVVGCFLVERGSQRPRGARWARPELWQESDRSQTWPHVPETDDQIEFVLKWTPQISTVVKRRVTPQPPPPPGKSAVRHLGPGVGAIAALPQLVEPGERLVPRESPLDEVAGHHGAGAADAGPAMEVDDPALRRAPCRGSPGSRSCARVAAACRDRGSACASRRRCPVDRVVGRQLAGLGQVDEAR